MVRQRFCHPGALSFFVVVQCWIEDQAVFNLCLPAATALFRATWCSSHPEPEFPGPFDYIYVRGVQLLSRFTQTSRAALLITPSQVTLGCCTPPLPSSPTITSSGLQIILILLKLAF